jgi:hypothetical protein
VICYIDATFRNDRAGTWFEHGQRPFGDEVGPRGKERGEPRNIVMAASKYVAKQIQ